MKKTRSSSRAKKLSSAMRVVDDETRRIIQQNRIDALEADNLFETLREEEDDGGNAEDDMWDEYAGAGAGSDSEQDENSLFDNSKA